MAERLPGLKFLAFAIVCVIAAGWIASTTANLRRIPFFGHADHYEAVLFDASGLAEGDDVRVAGVPVGRVNGITLERGNAVVAFEIHDDITITDTWQVGARWRNVIGQRYLYLFDQPGGTPLDPGDRLPVANSVGVADIGRFFNEITPLLEAIDPQAQNILVAELTTALQGREARIQELVADLASLSDAVVANEPEVRALIANANTLLATYNAREDQLTSLLEDLADVSSTLAARNDELIAAGNDLADVQAALADLIDANDDRIEGSIDDLERVTQTLGRRRGDLEQALGNARFGASSYMLISRFGQWFNVRAVATQVIMGDEVVSCTTETGDPCQRPQNNSAPVGPGGPRGLQAPATSIAPTRFDALSAVVAAPIAASDAGAGS